MESPGVWGLAQKARPKHKGLACVAKQWRGPESECVSMLAHERPPAIPTSTANPEHLAKTFGAQLISMSQRSDHLGRVARGYAVALQDAHLPQNIHHDLADVIGWLKSRFTITPRDHETIARCDLDWRIARDHQAEVMKA